MNLHNFRVMALLEAAEDEEKKKKKAADKKGSYHLHQTRPHQGRSHSSPHLLPHPPCQSHHLMFHRPLLRGRYHRSQTLRQLIRFRQKLQREYERIQRMRWDASTRAKMNR